MSREAPAGPQGPGDPLGGSAPDTARRGRRDSLRLRGYDYSTPGWYLVTVCTRGRRCWLGRANGGRIVPSRAGQAVERAWQEAPLLWPTVDLKALVVMSNHLHALVRLRAPAEGAMNRAPTLGQVVRGLKARSSRQARGGALPGFAWQRGYHDRILRRTEEIQVAYDYVRTNPARWAEDADNLLAHHGAGAWDVPGRRGGL